MRRRSANRKGFADLALRNDTLSHTWASPMSNPLSSIRARLDRAGVVLSGLCLLHCLASIVVVSALGIGGEFLLAPAFHRVGLAIALVIAAVAIGWGALTHRRAAPFVTAMTGLSFMGGALAMPHGTGEVVLTVIGVSLVSIGHFLNLRHAH